MVEGAIGVVKLHVVVVELSAALRSIGADRFRLKLPSFSRPWVWGAEVLPTRITGYARAIGVARMRRMRLCSVSDRKRLPL